MEEFKCKLKDLIHDLLLLDVTEITLDDSGIGMCVADNLRFFGVKVKTKRRWKNL